METHISEPSPPYISPPYPQVTINLLSISIDSPIVVAVESLSCASLFAAPWIAALQALLSIIICLILPILCAQSLQSCLTL